MRNLVVLLGVMLVLAGCAGETPTPTSPTAVEAPLAVVPNAYLGRAGESKVLVAVVPGNGSVRVYACDAEDLRNATVDQWFQGAFDGTGAVTLTAGGLKVTVSAVDGGYAGELVLADGRALPYKAAKAGEGSALLDAELRDPATGAVVRDGNVIVLGAEQRGTFAPARPPKCRMVLVTGNNGQQQWMAVC